MYSTSASGTMKVLNSSNWGKHTLLREEAEIIVVVVFIAAAVGAKFGDACASHLLASPPVLIFPA